MPEINKNSSESHLLHEVQEKDRQFRSSIVKAQEMLNMRVPADGSILINTYKFAVSIPNETARDAALLLLHSGEMMKLFLWHKEYGKDAKAKNGINYGLIASFNEYMQKVIKDAENTLVEPEYLAKHIAFFACQHYQLSKKLSDEYVGELMEVIKGMTAEQDVADLLTTAQIKNRDSDPETDSKKGIDLFVKTKGDNNWYGIDVKSSWSGIVDCAEKSDGTIQEFVFQKDGSINIVELKPWEERTKASIASPVIHLLPFRGKFALSVDFDGNHNSQLLAPRKFNASSLALQLIKAVKQYMDDYANQANIAQDNPIEIYNLEDGQFKPEPEKITIKSEAAKTALRRVVIS